MVHDVSHGQTGRLLFYKQDGYCYLLSF